MIIRQFFLLAILISLNFIVINVAYSSANEGLGIVSCERIKRQSICEEYALMSLPDSDRQLITKHCTVGVRCPDNNRIGRCMRYKDPDGLVFDKHYYQGAKKKHDWNASTIEETCLKHGGKFEEG